MDYSINIQIFDNNTQISTTSERKNYIKYLGILAPVPGKPIKLSSD